MRKVELEITVKVMARLEDDVDVDDFFSELEYEFTDGTMKGEVEDTELTDFVVKDSK